MTAPEITRHTLSYLRLRAAQGGVTDEELRGINGLANFLILMEEVELPEAGTPLTSELMADSQQSV